MGDAEARAILAEALDQVDLAGARVLILIPDGTRSGPLDLFFRLFHELLWGEVEALDYLIALGTHPAMTQAQICKRLGVSASELAGRYGGVRIFNHEWQRRETFETLGTIGAKEIERITGGLFSIEVPVSLNRRVLDYDRVVVCGPVFPHEVAGFSGGTKYFFPGISGPELINLTHWLGALITCYEIIGTKHTPVREVIDRAAAFIPTPKLFCCFVSTGEGLAGLYVGETLEAWTGAADLSSKIHVKRVPNSYRQIVALMPEMYDDVWTAGKGMYKLEPVCADGGEVILYAPHISEISYTHGKVIDEIGYHVRDYFLKQWGRFKGYPWGVLAHSTHVRGLGTYAAGVEEPRVRVTLATGIPRERCEKVNLGYLDPAAIDPKALASREAEGILVVPRAGETLYRLGGR